MASSKAALRFGLLTTLDTNIGDDFIRTGICAVLKQVFQGRELQFVPINKHNPYSVYPDWHPIHLRGLTQHLPRGRARARRLIDRLAPKLGLSRFDGCDAVIQCGTPVMWPNCSQCEWARPLWYDVVGRLSRKGIPVLNLGAGSGFPWERQPRQVTDCDDAEYLREMLSYCRVTTVRDKLARNLFESLGSSCELIPCPALLTGKTFVKSPELGDLVVLNYMEKGGHYDWRQKVDVEAWKHTVREFIARNLKQHRFLFVCHDRKEYALAAEVNPQVPRCQPCSLTEYFKVISGAKAALCNRLHASIALAGLGIPSVSVGVDSRLLMVEAVDLPNFYVKEASPDRIQQAFDDLLARAAPAASGSDFSTVR